MGSVRWMVFWNTQYIREGEDADFTIGDDVLPVSIVPNFRVKEGDLIDVYKIVDGRFSILYRGQCSATDVGEHVQASWSEMSF